MNNYLNIYVKFLIETQNKNPLNNKSFNNEIDILLKNYLYNDFQTAFHDLISFIQEKQREKEIEEYQQQ